MAEPVSTVSVSVMKSLLQLSKSNELTVAALEKAAAGANISLGELLHGIQVQQGGPIGPARGFANSLFSAISKLPEAANLTKVMNNAAKQTAVQLVEKGGEVVARQGVKELALNAGRATRQTLIRIATKIGQLIVGNSPKAGLLGGVILTLVIGVILWKLIGMLNDPMNNLPGQPGSNVAGAGGGRDDPNDGRLKGSESGSSLPGSGDAGTSSIFNPRVAPASLDKKSFHGVWVRPSLVQVGISRAVLVQSGNSVTGRVEVVGAISGGGKMLLPSGTYDLSGTINADNNRLQFTLDKFTGDFGLGRTGMHLDGYMYTDGGPPLGISVSLERQIEPPK